VHDLPESDIAAILRGADTMIGRGGRTQLSKLLKGSREKTVLEHDLDRCPSYGYYAHLSIDEILRRIDWIIQQRFLRIEYPGRLPVLVFPIGDGRSRWRRWRRSFCADSMAAWPPVRRTTAAISRIATGR
jgi:hypothetical protein